MMNLGLAFWINTVLTLMAHPFYVGVAEVAYDQEDQRIEVAVKLFTDDLERALREAYNAPVLDIAGENESSLTDSLIQEYLGEHFHITTNGKRIPMRYLGREGNVDASWVYIYFPTSKAPTTATIAFTAFFELFDDQRNLVHVKAEDFSTSICDKHSPTTTVSF